jgi:Bacterial regulatory proteins, luxR family
LVTRGLTNRQIAAELMISERTADRHVANTLSKLALSSRAQIAAWYQARSRPAAGREWVPPIGDSADAPPPRRR